MKIAALEESVDFVTIDTEKLFSKLKSHELSRKGHLNHDAYLTSKAFVTSTHVGNPSDTSNSSALEFALFLWPQLLMSSMRASPMTRSPCWRGSSALCTGSTRRRDHRGAASSAVTPPTSSSTAPSGRNSTPSPTNTTITTETTPATRARVRRSTTLGITRRIRSSKR
jgi:hypothetical protein